MTMTKAHDTPNWVAKFQFDPEEMQLDDPREVKVKSVLVNRGNVPKVYEYKKNKLVMIASKSVLLFDDFKFVREIKESMVDNFYTGSYGPLTIPLGYMQLLPNERNLPLFVIAGSNCISLVNLEEGYIEPLIIAESTVYFG